MRGQWQLALFVGVLGSAGAASCLSASSGGPSQAQEQARADAQQYFIASVYPSLSAGCGSCHSTTSKVAGANQFIAPTADATYTLIENTPQFIEAPAKSQLVTFYNANHPTTPGTLQELMLNWLTAEANARGLINTGTTPTTLQQGYAAFAVCMKKNYNLWDELNLTNLLPSTQTDTDGPCFSCHGQGQGGAWLSNDLPGTPTTFNNLQTFPYIEKLVIGAVDGNGHFASLIPARRFALKAEEQCPEGSTTCHPSFGLPPVTQSAIDEFVTLTLEGLTNGTCGNDLPAPDASATLDGGEEGQ